MRYDYDLLALELDEWLPRTLEQSTDGGVTIHAIAAYLEVPRKCADLTVAHHRRHLGTDSWAILQTVVKRETYVYWLSADPREISAYEMRRIDGDAMTRITTLYRVAERGVHYSDGRTVAGKRARLIAKYVRRLMEDINDLGGETG